MQHTCGTRTSVVFRRHARVVNGRAVFNGERWQPEGTATSTNGPADSCMSREATERKRFKGGSASPPMKGMLPHSSATLQAMSSNVPRFAAKHTTTCHMRLTQQIATSALTPRVKQQSPESRNHLHDHFPCGTRGCSAGKTIIEGRSLHSGQRCTKCARTERGCSENTKLLLCSTCLHVNHRVAELGKGCHGIQQRVLKR